MLIFRKLLFVYVVIVSLALFFTACGSPETADAVPTPTNTATVLPSPTNTTEPTHIPTATYTATAVPTDTPEPTHTPTAVPTEAALPVDDVVVVEEGGFIFQPVTGFITDVQENQAGIFSEDDEILLFMTANSADTEKTLQDVLADFVAAASADMDELTAGDPYPFSIDDLEGLAVDVTGALFGDALEGRIAIAAPNETQIFIAFGFAVNDRWPDEGSALFEAVLSSVSFAAEDLAADTDEIEVDTDDSEPNSDFPLPMPVGEPAAEWNDIPIMPEATAGEGDDKGYAFVAEATAVKVQSFYEQEMGKLGWSLLGVGEGETGTLLMIFQKEAEVASISIIAVDPNTMYVLMVK